MNANYNIPTKIGDKYTMDRFHSEKDWKETNTCNGFYVSYYEYCSKHYNTLDELLTNEHGVSVSENMKQTLLRSNYNFDEIMVVNKEHGGAIPIRNCVLI